MDTQKLALEAIASMNIDEGTNWQELAILCVTIARAELTNQERPKTNFYGLPQAIFAQDNETDE